MFLPPAQEFSAYPYRPHIANMTQPRVSRPQRAIAPPESYFFSADEDTLDFINPWMSDYTIKPLTI